MGITESDSGVIFILCYNLLNRCNFNLAANQAGSNILTSIF